MVSASMASWVTSSVTPSYDARWRPSSIRRAIATLTSRPVSGSSSSSRRGLVASARAIATRCAWPPESWRGRRSASSPMPKRSSQARASASASVALGAAGARPEGHVGQGRQVREEELALEDQADGAVAGRDLATGRPRRAGRGPRPAPGRPAPAPGTTSRRRWGRSPPAPLPGRAVNAASTRSATRSETSRLAGPPEPLGASLMACPASGRAAPAARRSTPAASPCSAPARRPGRTGG